MHHLNNLKKKVFDNCKVKVMAGDLAQGEYECKDGTLWGPFDQIELAAELKNCTMQTEESVKRISESLGWGLAANLIFGPMGLLAGLVMGGNHKEICALCELHDGRKFLAIMDTKLYQQFLAYSMRK